MSNLSPWEADFSIDSDYDPINHYDRLQFAAGSPIIHSEQNEYSQITNGKVWQTIEDSFTDGTFDGGVISYNPDTKILTIQGLRIKFQGRFYTIMNVAITMNDGDMCYFTTWEEILRGDSTIHAYGYVNGPVVPNHIFYSGWDEPVETTRRRSWVYDFPLTPPVPPQSGAVFGRVDDGIFTKLMPGVAQKLGMKWPYGYLVNGPTDYTTVIDAFPEYNDGQVYLFIPTEENLANPTVNVNGKGPVRLQTVDGIDLVAGDMGAYNAYLFAYLDTGIGEPTFRLIGTALHSGTRVRPHTHDVSDLPIRTQNIILRQDSWTALTAPEGTPIAGQTTYVQYHTLPEVIEGSDDNPIMAYFEANPTDINISALINYVAISGRWIVFHASEQPVTDFLITNIQYIGGSLGEYVNPDTPPTSYPMPIVGHGFGNLGGSPWFAKFFSKTPNKAGTFYEGSQDPTGTTRLNYSGYLYATRFYNGYYRDFAEAYNVVDEWETGDLISINPNNPNEYVLASEKNNVVVGVVSDEFGHLIGARPDEANVPVGVAGRVHANVSGPVKVGDLLKVSAIPGVAVAWTGTKYPHGKIVGKALENNNAEETKKVLMQIMLA